MTVHIDFGLQHKLALVTGGSKGIGDVSLILDGEDGFGNALSVMRTVRELEVAGVAAFLQQEGKGDEMVSFPD